MPDGSDASPPTLVGRHVRAALERVGMSQADLARGLGVNESTVSRLVRGEIDVRVTMLVAISNILDRPPCELIHGDEPEQAAV